MKLILNLCIMIGICLVFSAVGFGKWYPNTTYAASCNTNGLLLPDLQTVVPQHLQLVNNHQREVLRLSNGVANTGHGAWQMIPVIPADKNNPQKANQQFLNSNGDVVATCPTDSESVYHPAHKHFHISGVSEFSVHSGSIDGDTVGIPSLKVTSCLIDWIRLEGNSPDSQRGYSSCDSGVQGVTPRWVDQYHMALEGQSIDITNADPGIYYLVSKANPKGYFIEENYKNDEAWVKFNLQRDSNGNPKITIVGHSQCTDGLCGEDFPNR